MDMDKGTFNLKEAFGASECYVIQEPYINDEGIFIPERQYVPFGCSSAYRMLISKEMFIEAYNKWIGVGEQNEVN